MKVPISFLAGITLLMAGLLANIGKLPADNHNSIGLQYGVIGLAVIVVLVPILGMLGSSRRVFGTELRARAVHIAVLPSGLLFLQLASLVRTGLSQSIVTTAALYNLALMALMILVYGGVAYILDRSGKIDAYWRYFGWSIFAYAAAGVVLSLFGMESIVTGGGNLAVLPSLFGFDVVRESLPMFSGLNSTGTVLGAGIVALISFGGRTRYLLLVPMLIAMALVDARASFFAVAVALMISVAATKHSRMMGGAFVLAVVGGAAIMDLGGLLDSVTRTPGDFSTSRVDLWQIAIRELGDWEFVHMVGYGAFGQTVSGLSKEFYGFFSDEVYEVATLHNCTLQMVFDIGYLGLVWWGASWLFVLRLAWKWFSARRTEEARFTFMIAVYLFTIGFFQSSCGYSENDSLFIHVALFVGAALSFVRGSPDSRTLDRLGSPGLHVAQRSRENEAE